MDHGFFSSSTVKRKPLPSSSKHDWRVTGDIADGGSFPLMPMETGSTWNPPPQYEDTSYDSVKQSHITNSPRQNPKAGSGFFNIGSHYSRLSSTTDVRKDHDSTSKPPGIFQYASPLDTRSTKSARMWNSGWLHPLVLSSFIVLFLALLAGLIILWHFADLQNGISTRISNNKYLWTYGPTALLVVITVAWKQVDYSCRILTPWQHLRAGPSPARTGLLLDYVSPILPHALVIAAARRDWAVLASSMGVLVLRIVIVFSTALLVLTPTSVSKNVNDATLNSKFMGTNTTETVIRDTEVMRYYGIQKYGMDYQYGTTDTAAYETLDLRSFVENSTVTTIVNAVHPYFDCEVIKPKIVEFSWLKDTSYPWQDKLKLNMTMSSQICPIVHISYPSICSPTSGGCSFGYYKFSDQQWYEPQYWFTNVSKAVTYDYLNPCNNLYALSITELYIKPIAGHPVNSSAAWNVTLTRNNGIICRMAYSVNTVKVKVNTRDPTSSETIDVSGPIARVADVLPGYLYDNFSSDFRNQNSVYGLQALPEAPYIGGFAKVFAQLVGGSADTLLDPDVLKSTAEIVGKGVGVQVMNQYLRKPDSRKVAATLEFNESRLQVRMISVWAMGLGFGILACLALVVLFWRPVDVLPHKPNAIAQYVATLAGSHSLQKSLEGTGLLSDIQMEKHLSSVTASSHVTTGSVASAFSIKATSHEETYDLSSKRSESSLVWWRPMSVRVWFMVSATALPLAIIILLEILQRGSDAHNGLLDISSTSLLSHSLPSISASLVMILTAAMYDAIDFVAATLAPYQALVRGASAGEYSMFGGLWGDPLLWSTVGAFWSQVGACTVSAFAAILGSLLTIIASGLYSIEDVPRPLAISVLAADRFTPSFNITTDSGAGAVFNLMMHNNASYPPLTYDELAFPAFNVSGLEEGTGHILPNKSATITINSRLPAIRAALNCTVVPRESMKTRLYYYKTTTCPETYVEFNVSLPVACPVFLDGHNNVTQHIQFLHSAQFDCSDPNKLSAARGQRLFSQNGNSSTTMGRTLGAITNPPECPSLAFIQGYWLVNSTSTENITAITCVQGLEKVYAETFLEVSGEAIHIKVPPIVDESSRQWLTAFNSTVWFTQYSYFDAFHYNGSYIDEFYQALNYGPDAVPAEALVGPANIDRFITATQHTYRKWMAQYISLNMRQSLNDADSESRLRYNATVSSTHVQRLKQNATSKLVLQICLAVMLVCAIVVYSWRDMRHVLPHCPWSIAGLMSLLAGSEMVDRKTMPPGAEFMNDKELSKVLDGYMFSLGWWNTGSSNGIDGGQKRFGIDIGKADTSARRTWMR